MDKVRLGVSNYSESTAVISVTMGHRIRRCFWAWKIGKNGAGDNVLVHWGIPAGAFYFCSSCGVLVLASRGGHDDCFCVRRGGS